MPLPISGVASYTMDGQKILVYSKNLNSLCKHRAFRHGFKVIKACENPKLEWFRLRFTEPTRYRLDRETDTRFPGVVQHPNGSWHACFDWSNHFGYYRNYENAVNALRDFVLTGKTVEHTKGRKGIAIDIDKLRNLYSKKLYLYEIADELGVSTNTLVGYIRRFKIKRDKF